MSIKKKVTILTDNKTSIPIPVDGPHNKISNSKFRHFWAYAVSPKAVSYTHLTLPTIYSV